MLQKGSWGKLAAPDVPTLMARAALLALGLVSSLSLGFNHPPASVAQSIPGNARLQPKSSGLPQSNNLSVEEARAAANRILEAIQTGDPNLRYSQFSDQLKAKPCAANRNCSAGPC
jgi:hypothetical protein